MIYNPPAYNSPSLDVNLSSVNYAQRQPIGRPISNRGGGREGSSNSSGLFRGMGIIRPSRSMAVDYNSPPMPPSTISQMFSSGTSNYSPNIPPPMKSYTTSSDTVMSITSPPPQTINNSNNNNNSNKQ